MYLLLCVLHIASLRVLPSPLEGALGVGVMHRDAELNLDFLFIIKTFLLFILFAHTMQQVGS